MQENHQYIRLVGNPINVGLYEIPSLGYSEFYSQTAHILMNPECRCIAYFARKVDKGMLLIMAIANNKNEVLLYSHSLADLGPIESITPKIPALHIYEREIHENYGIQFINHPWLKPVRYSFDRANKEWMDCYPFFKISSNELHEVGVGPIHAGVIEPGHFRFICNGEKVLHLEIQLGYQHRGVERLLSSHSFLMHKNIVAENIAGDSAVSHALAFVLIAESLSGIGANSQLELERTIAQEMERIAVHIGDTAALCGDIAYQLGLVVCEALRTVMINTTQYWCGNRFGKGMIRIGGTHYPMGEGVRQEITKNLTKVKREYMQLSETLLSLPSVLARFEGVGEVIHKQVVGIGAVGMSARMANLERDVRKSNPYCSYKAINHEPVLKEGGDVMARLELRVEEVAQSIDRVLLLLQQVDTNLPVSKPKYDVVLQSNRLSLSLVEGWRGEICHVAITDDNGEICAYKVKDPSFHNWFALALAVRSQEISDFPICNKSFNLSYCGNDL